MFYLKLSNKWIKIINFVCIVHETSNNQKWNFYTSFKWIDLIISEIKRYKSLPCTLLQQYFSPLDFLKFLVVDIFKHGVWFRMERYPVEVWANAMVSVSSTWKCHSEVNSDITMSYPGGFTGDHLTVSSLLPMHGELTRMISQIAHSKLMVWVANSQKTHSVSSSCEFTLR